MESFFATKIRFECDEISKIQESSDSRWLAWMFHRNDVGATSPSWSVEQLSEEFQMTPQLRSLCGRGDGFEQI